MLLLLICRCAVSQGRACHYAQRKQNILPSSSSISCICCCSFLFTPTPVSRHTCLGASFALMRLWQCRVSRFSRRVRVCWTRASRNRSASKAENGLVSSTELGQTWGCSCLSRASASACLLALARRYQAVLEGAGS